jgi:hypothetical protein
LTLSHLQAAGINGMDGPGTGIGVTGGDPTWVISDEQKDIYRGYFQKAIAQDGSNAVSGTTAKALFSRSNLPNTVLAEIWMLSDANKDGQLSLPEFMIAMHLINMALQGKPMPSVLPESFVVAVGASAASPLSASPIASPAANPPPRTPANSLTAPLQPGQFETSPSHNASLAHAAYLAQQQQQQEEEKRKELQRLRTTVMDVRKFPSFVLFHR